MLIIFTRAIIIYVFLLIAMRLMGKKQLGELQPFEFAITLIAAELSCIPMSDTTVPISYGLVPIFTLFVLHLILTKMVKHSIKLRKVINGKPIIIINPNGIDFKKICELDMTVNDLLESLRGSGYFSPAEVRYAIVETNGDLSIMPKAGFTPSIYKDMDITIEEPEIPITIICEGKKMGENMQKANLSDEFLLKILEKYKLKQKSVLLLTITDETDIYIQPINEKAIETTVEEIR